MKTNCKISQLNKPVDPDDPMEIKASAVVGDERLMMECLIEEFAHLGWNAKKIAKIFNQPFFLASHGLEKRFGREAVLECIEDTLTHCGVFHFEMKEPSAFDKESSTSDKECPTSVKQSSTQVKSLKNKEIEQQNIIAIRSGD